MTVSVDRVVEPPEPRSDSPEAQTTHFVRRAVAGDVQSLEWVVAHLSPLLLAHASYRLGPALRRHHDPADLVGEAWLIALPRLAGLSTRDGRHTPVLLRFLTTTVVHRVHALLKRHARERPDDAAAADPVSVSGLPADASGAITRALHREREDVVRECMDSLADSDRQILILRGIEQLSTKAVAAQLGLTAEAAGKRYRRALARLRERLPRSVFDELVDE